MADLQFKYSSDQEHQTKAIDAVVNLFQGQEFLSREFSGDIGRGGQQQAFAVGHANGLRVSSRLFLSIMKFHEWHREVSARAL